MTELEKEELKRQNTLRFIEATQEIIDTDGLEKISIRKIAEKAGFHNSTIYLYFKDVNELILLASLKHFAEYSQALSELEKKAASPLENFLYIWRFFGKTVFKKPQIFYNFFFGKYSDNLTPIITQYYELFPAEKPRYSKEIEDMYYGNTINERCLSILKPLVECPGVRVNQENLILVNTIIVSCLKELLTENCQKPELTPCGQTEKLLEMIEYIVQD